MSVSHPRNDIMTVVQTLGLSPNLKLCLDAGDSLSYSSGQKWLDRSGGGYDFFVGFDGTIAGNDPTINGTIGERRDTNYWSVNGAQYFTYDTTNETWMNNLHKANAKHSFCGWFYYNALGSDSLFGFAFNDTARIGVELLITAAGIFGFRVRNGSVNLNVDSVVSVPTARWNFLNYNFDMAAGAGSMRINDTQEAKTFSYPSPSAANASHTMQLLTRGNQGNIALNGDRLASFCMWEGRTLTPEEVSAFYLATKGKYGV